MTARNVMIVGVNAKDIPRVWPSVLPLLEPAIHRAEYSTDDVFEELWNKDMQLWLAYENERLMAALTTKIQVYPAGKVAVLVHMGGRWDACLKEYLAQLKAWASYNGAQTVRIIGRSGWKRVLKEYFKETGVIMEM